MKNRKILFVVTFLRALGVLSIIIITSIIILYKNINPEKTIESSTEQHILELPIEDFEDSHEYRSEDYEYFKEYVKNFLTSTQPLTIRSQEDLDNNLEAIKAILVFYFTLGHIQTDTFPDYISVSFNEYKRLQEIINTVKADSERFIQETISRERLEHFMEIGILPEITLTEENYPITYKGTYGNLQYVTLDGEEYSLFIEEPEMFDEWLQKEYFETSIPDIIMTHLAYDSETNTVLSILQDTTNNITKHINLSLDETGVIQSNSREILFN